MPENYIENQHKYNLFHKDGSKVAYAEQANRQAEILVRSLLGKVPLNSVIDVGCRMGYTVSTLTELLPTARVVGVDIVPEFVKDALEAGGEIYEADMHEMPFEDDEFDLTFCYQTLEHCYDVPKATRELGRITKTALYISVPIESEISFQNNPSHYARHTTREWIDIFHESVGDEFRIDQLYTVGNPYISTLLLKDVKNG